MIKVLNTEGSEDWWSVKQEPTLSPALALPPGGSELNNSAQSQVETRLKKQIHKKYILPKHMNPCPLMMELQEINLDGKHFNNDVHLCTPLH